MRQADRMHQASNGLVGPAGEGAATDLADLEAREQAARARYEARARLSSAVYPIGTLVVVVLVWEMAARQLNVPTYLLPRPSEVVRVLSTESPLLLQHGWISTQEVILGYILSILVGIPLGLVVYLWPIFARSIYPLLVSSQAVPKTAIAPLFVVWFGFGVLPKVLIAFLIAFFPVVISTVVGLASIEPEKIYLAKSMGMNGWTTFFKIRLPQAAPSILGGLKIAVTLAVVGAVVGEFVGADAGLGYLLLIANGNLDTPLLFAGLFALTVIGVVAFSLIEILERFAIPWHTSQRRTDLGGTM